MKKIIIALVALISVAASAQINTLDDWANLKRYRKANAELPAKSGTRVVFMGNSITDGWASQRPDFFAANGFVGRGIGGQTTPQMLLRFVDDVVKIGADKVVILAGTNDIAANTGEMTLAQTVEYIAAMCDIAQSRGIEPYVCSVLPASTYPWRPEKKPNIDIPKLNAMLWEYCNNRGIAYVDYFSEMTNADNGLNKELAEDGVHPTARGYEIMEKIILNALK